MNTIFNDEKSFKKIVSLCKKYFENVSVVKNKNSHLAIRSQNFYIIILFESRGTKFSIKWNHNHSTLFFGDITRRKITSFQFTFTKIRLDNYYPVEEGNNSNVMFWEVELTDAHDCASQPVSPLRLPITLKKINK